MGVVVALVAQTALAATLDGDVVTISISETNNGILDTVNVLVGVGEDGNFFDNTFFDLNAGVDGDLFEVRSTLNFCGVVCLGGRVTYTLTGLDFSDGEDLIGFTVFTSPAPVTIDALTSTSLTFSFDDAAQNTGVFLSGQFLTEGSGTDVPLPAPGLLLLGGLAGLATAGRRRGRAARA